MQLLIQMRPQFSTPNSVSSISTSEDFALAGLATVCGTTLCLLPFAVRLGSDDCGAASRFAKGAGHQRAPRLQNAGLVAADTFAKTAGWFHAIYCFISNHDNH
jgi:hypothetical protein